MKKSKIIGISLGVVGLVATSTVVATTLTSCSSSKNFYDPDTSSRIMEIIPDKKTFDEILTIYKRTASSSVQNAAYTGTANMSVSKNILTLKTSVCTFPYMKIVKYKEYVYNFQNEGNITYSVTIFNGNQTIPSGGGWTTMEKVKSDITSITGYRFQ